MESRDPRVAVVMITHNRREEVLRSLAHLTRLAELLHRFHVSRRVAANDCAESRGILRGQNCLGIGERARQRRASVSLAVKRVQHMTADRSRPAKVPDAHAGAGRCRNSPRSGRARS